MLCQIFFATEVPHSTWLGDRGNGFYTEGNQGAAEGKKEAILCSLGYPFSFDGAFLALNFNFLGNVEN